MTAQVIARRKGPNLRAHISYTDQIGVVFPSACVAGRAVNQSRCPPAEPACLTDHLVPDASAPRAATACGLARLPNRGLFLFLFITQAGRRWHCWHTCPVSSRRPQFTTHHPPPVNREPSPTTHRPISPVLSSIQHLTHTSRAGRRRTTSRRAESLPPSLPLRRPARRAPGPERRRSRCRCTAH